MLLDELCKALVGFIPLAIGGDRAKFGRRNFDGEIERALVADVDDDRRRGKPRDSLLRRGKPRLYVSAWGRDGACPVSHSGEKLCNLFERLLRGREADANRFFSAALF